jgi:hypothetical protein
MATYRSKTISLADDVWAELERLRKQHGSYNKALRAVLLVGSGGKASRVKPGRKVKQGRQ